MAQSSASSKNVLLPRSSASAPEMPPRSCKVAVIGAGVSGLVTARELTREGHDVTVFEKSDRVGGTWVYSPDTDSDPSGFDPARKVVHGSLYRSLRTNLPRPIMGFTDYPFPGPAESFRDPRFFPAHEEVLAFLEGFARETGVLGLVRFGAEVVRVRMGRSKDEWAVEFRRGEGADEESEVEVFEAVVVCNGHHTEPRLADFPGIDKWPGEQIHSHNYRVPEPFQDQILVVIGKETSAHDISRELSKVAKEVHLASRSPDVEVGKLFGFSNIWQHSMISSAKEDGLVVFGDGSSVHADIIFHCTGYNYRFPFLDAKETVSIDENRVGPLYKHVFPPRLAPWLSFVGIPYKNIIFMMLELQSRWVAQVLSKKITLPPEEDMVVSIDDYYLQMDEIDKPKHHTHSLNPNQIEFLNWLAAEVGLPPLEDWRVQLYHTVSQRVSSHDDGYRDTLVADYWIQQWQLSQQRV